MREVHAMAPDSMAHALVKAGIERTAALQFSDVRLPFVPRKDQVEALQSSLYYPRSGLFSEARTGKSIVFQTIMIFIAKYRQRSIVAMPPVLFTQFSQSWEEIEGEKPPLFVLNQAKKKRKGLIRDWILDEETAPPVLLMSHAMLTLELADIGHLYRLLVIDESHMRLQNETNQFYNKVVGYLARHRDNRLILSTGTPVPNEMRGAYPTISLLTPEKYEGRSHFDAMHVVWKQITVRGKFGPRLQNVVHDYRALDLLHRNLYRQAYRVTKAEVLGLKAPNIQIVPVTLSSQHMSLYRRAMKIRVFELGDQVITAIRMGKLRAIALQLLTDPNSFTDVLIKENAVHEAVSALLSSVGCHREGNEKAVLFANYTASVERLVKDFHILNPAVVYGPNGSRKNGEEVERFRNDPGCKLLVANPQAGGVGLKLGDICTTAIFVEPVGNHGTFDQAASRVMLTGQKEPVSVYILKVLKTISPKAIENMMMKGGDAKEVNMDKQTVMDELLGVSI